MHMSYSCLPPTSTTTTTTTTTSITNTTANAATSTVNTAAIPTAIRTMDPKRHQQQQQLIKTHDLNIFIAPCSRYNNNVVLDAHPPPHGDAQTLQLFPLRSGDGTDNSTEKENEISIAAVTPYQFFEFLPLKN